MSALLVFSGGASQASSYGLADCVSAWNDSPASDYCTGDVGFNSYSPTNYSCAVGYRCSITVSVGDSETEFQLNSISARKEHSREQMSTLELCFEENDGRPHGYRLSMERECSDSQTDAETAEEDGLPAVE